MPLNIARHCPLILLLLPAAGCTVDWEKKPTGFWETGSGQNEAPKVSITAPTSGQEFTFSESVLVSGLVEDDGNVLDTYLSINSNLSGLLAEPDVLSDGTWEVDVGALESGSHTLLVTAYDDGGLQASATVNIRVLDNQPPTDPVVEIQPPDPIAGERLEAVLSTESEDPDGDEISYVWAWQVDGVDRTDLLGPVVDGTEVDLGEIWAVEVYATDGPNVSASSSDSVEVIDGLPEIVLSLEPTSPSVSDTLTCTWTSEDPDGQPITSETGTWLIDGIAAGSADQPLSSGFGRDDVVTCEVSATSVSGTATERAEVTIQNSPPSVDSISLGGIPATEQSTLTCEITTSDADGDTVTTDVTWFVNGSNVATGVLELDGNDFDRDDEVWCEATPSDGTDSGGSVASAHTIIDNTAPSRPTTVAISPSEVPVGTPLYCEVTGLATDVDPNDTVSYQYRWKVDTAVASGETSQDFLTDGLVPGQEVTCEARATDGTDNSGYRTSAVADIIDRLDGGRPASSASLVIRSTTNDGRFGRAIANVGDIDGDGQDDLAIGGYGYDSEAGTAFLYTATTLQGAGGAGLGEADADWTFEGSAAEGRLGAAEFTHLGDVDGDGIDDLFVSAFLANNEDGEAYLLYGGDRSGWASASGISDAASVVLSGPSGDGNRMGGAISGGDIDGDNMPELFLGEARNDTTASNAGAIRVFLGASLPGSGSLDGSDSDYDLWGASSGDGLSQGGLAVVGDVNGDGHDDLGVSAYNATGGGDNSGITWLVSGESLATGTIDSIAFAEIQGTDEDDDFGVSVAGAGDLDGDSVDDFLIGARYASVGVENAGSVYAWFGSSGLTGTIAAASADASWGSGKANDLFGKFVIANVDMDLDGLNDILMSSHYYDLDTSDTAAGRSYLTLGSSAASWTTGMSVGSVAQATFSGIDKNDYVGNQGTLLDADGDGYGDVVVGADGDDSGANNAGSVYIFYGP